MNYYTFKRPEVGTPEYNRLRACVDTFCQSMWNYEAACYESDLSPYIPEELERYCELEEKYWGYCEEAGNTAIDVLADYCGYSIDGNDRERLLLALKFCYSPDLPLDEIVERFLNDAEDNLINKDIIIPAVAYDFWNMIEEN